MKLLKIPLALAMSSLLLGCSATPRSAVAAAAAKTPPRRPLPALPPHPRLLASAERFKQLNACAKTDPVVRKWYDEVVADAKKYVTAPALKYEPAKGIEIAREIAASRHAPGGGLSADQRPRAGGSRGRTCSTRRRLPDWDQPSFLATAEMTAGVAMGYDLLFDVLSNEDRAA